MFRAYSFHKTYHSITTPACYTRHGFIAVDGMNMYQYKAICM